MDRKWKIGSLLGIPFYINSSWFLILGLITLSNVQEINIQGLAGNSWWLEWLSGLFLSLFLFISVLSHELGHSLVAHTQGINVKSITLFLFGGVAIIEKESEKPTEAFLIAIAGPLVSLVLSIILFTINHIIFPNQESSLLHPLLSYMLEDIARMNFVLGVFNLIPGLPLDGGQIVKAIVWKLKDDYFIGVRYASISGRIIGWLGIILGLFIISLTGSLGGFWIVIVGWFVLRNANNYGRVSQLQKSFLEITAAEVMTNNFRIVNANLTLYEFIHMYDGQKTHGTAYFAASEGRYRGLLSNKDLKKIEYNNSLDCLLRDIAHPLDTISSVEEKTLLIKVIDKLEESEEYYITVLSPAGAVVGIIDRGDIVKKIASYNNLPISDDEIKYIKENGEYPSYLELSAISKTIQYDPEKK
ncbi:MAG: Zn-dependent protease [Candidatus Atelocyanobacterium thalassa isolate SIO64986]|uniref:Zinc metalloprotease n=1 Tax=Candidatus Atelocyanobacterium thalassa isolate SIO64986 TaxID=1527444 RepID=A0A086CI67_9CHRO|nr:MAG: Zn-dependent protease [Candidatus Atelocyanobacterium thalassa isolate SIO64986]